MSSAARRRSTRPSGAPGGLADRRASRRVAADTDLAGAPGRHVAAFRGGATGSLGPARRGARGADRRAWARSSGRLRRQPREGRDPGAVTPGSRPPARAEQRPERLGEDVHDLLAHEANRVVLMVLAHVATSPYHGARVNSRRRRRPGPSGTHLAWAPALALADCPVRQPPVRPRLPG